MPEGDTIFRTARTLERALASRVVTVFETVLPALSRVHDDSPIVGRVVAGVRPAGKHLLIELSGALTLHTHMRMNGSWHVYRPGERWRRSRAAMRVVLGNDEYVAVAFDVPVAEFLTADQLRRHPVLTRLGPDPLSGAFDPGEAAARLVSRPDRPLVDALLDQRSMAGLGNVFKSEVLFLCRLDPWREVGTLSADEVQQLVRTSERLLRANVPDGSRPSTPSWGGDRRTTGRMNPEARLWVYGRGGRPCRECGTPIEYRKGGLDARGTYWCPRCQR